MDELINSLKGHFLELNKLQNEQLEIVNDEIEFIISNNIIDEKRIEKDFDILIDLLYWFGEDIKECYYKLTNFYKKINYDAGLEYEEIYMKIINEDDIDE